MKRTLSCILLFLLCGACSCDQSDTTAATSSAPPSGATSATSTATKTAQAAPKPAATGSWADLASFTNEVAAVAIAAAKGEEVDAKWGLQAKAAEGADEKLNGAKHVLTTIEVEAIRKAGGYVRTNVLVFPDGRVRWVRLEHRPRAHVGVTEGLDKAEPRLAKTTQQLIAILTGDKCELPLMAEEDTSQLAAPIRGEMKDPKPGLDQTCAAMKGVRDGWIPRYDDFTAVLDKDGAIVSVRSVVRVEDGKLVLGEPRLR